MKTDALIAMLAGQAGAVPRHTILRGAVIGAVLAGVAAFALMVWLLGVNPRLAAFLSLPGFWFKLAFAAALSGAGCVVSWRLAKPGVVVGGSGWLVVAPLAIVWALSILVLADAEPALRSQLVLGNTWRTCPINIAILSLPALAAGLWMLRAMAPTRLRLAGAACGLAAGGLGAMVYGLHCPELAAPFLGVWYVLGVLIPTIVGMALGPRVLRW